MPKVAPKSITRRLTRMNILVSAAALLMAFAGFIAYDAFTYRNRLVYDLSIQAQIIASNSTAALLFDDPHAAQNTIAALAVSPTVIYAGIQTTDGEPFAEYRPENRAQAGELPALPAGREEGQRFDGGGVTLQRSILFDGKRVGVVVIRASLQELWSRLIERGLVAGGVLAVSLLGAFLLSSVFRRTIAQPVVDLAQLAHTVSREKNYSVRATPTGSGDEIDLLGNSFNEMLGQIADRDAALQRSRDELEQRVRQRTAELSTTNEALEASRELYRQLFDNNPHPVWVYDLNTLGFLDVNLASILHYGYTREEFLEMSIRDIRPADDVPLMLESVSKAKSASEITGAWRHRKKDGSVIDVEVTSHPMLYAGRPARLVVATDITARKQAEDALRASEERFRSVVEAASDAVISADQAGNIIQFNSAAERIFGSSADEMIGQPLTVLMPPSLRSAHRAGFERYHSTGEAHVLGKTVELIGLRRSGEEFPIELSLESWRSGDKMFFTGLLRDITERRRAEQLLRQQKAELESANQELEAFCYSVSHDLRAPLRGIDGFSQALLEDYADKLDEDGKSHLHRVRAATQRMAMLIDDLLDLSRVTRTEMRREQVDLTQCAESVATDLQKSQPQRKVELQITPGLVAEGDARLLRQVLENLLSNAWKFTGKQASARIAFGVTQHNGKQAFFVSDDGAGFEPAYADRLFGVFQRLHSITDFPGTGVGLAIVQRIVHRHGGSVWAESTVGRGATFYFTLGSH